MAKRKKGKQRATKFSSGNQPPKAQPVKPEETMAEQIHALHEEATEEVTADDIDRIPEPSIPDTIELQAVYKEAQEARELFKMREERARNAEEAAQQREKEWQEKIRHLDEREAALNENVEQFEAQQLEYEETAARFHEEQTALREREDALRERELNAELGFEAERQQVIQQKEKELQALRDELAQLRKQKLEETRHWDEERQQRRDALEVELQTKRAEEEALLAKQRATVEEQLQEAEEQHRASVREKRQLALDRELLDEDKEDLKHKVEQMAAAHIQRLENQHRAVQERLDVSKQDVDRLENLLAQREESDRRFGHRTPDEVMKELQDLIKQRDQLQQTLSTRPSEEAVERLSRLESEKEEWESERIALRQENLSLKGRIKKHQIAVLEMETLRYQKAAYASSNDLLRRANDELRNDVDQLTNRTTADSPFPACSAMDTDPALQEKIPSTSDIDDLSTFVDYLQQAIAYNPETGKELYYSKRDVRCFLGGLAMSRLHLLQGISGTGKTSLPLAFARAIGAGCELIEIQAGWRDRNDLIGHFNTFEKIYYESEFLQALYKAQCPRFASLPFIIVLDEMNLSHPEQYFADFLSVLEQDEALQDIDLLTHSLESGPTLLMGGKTLKVPSNVWFVGTANHDETTQDFADKTYDRAHVMELPRHRDTFATKKQRIPPPYTYQALRSAFEKARGQYKKEARATYQFLEERFGKILEERFRVGWGNRLERQIESYLPVVIAAGGSIGEAADHIFATKILRKIRDRFDNRVDNIRILDEALDISWQELDKENRPDRSKKIVMDELRRLQGYAEEEDEDRGE